MGLKPDFVLPLNRPAVREGEPQRSASAADPRYPDNDWVGFRHQGGGKVPDDYTWTSNPKQDQDEAEGG